MHQVALGVERTDWKMWDSSAALAAEVRAHALAAIAANVASLLIAFMGSPLL
jgi:hypothetical protein